MSTRRFVVLAALAALAGCATAPAEPPLDRARLQASLLELEKASWQMLKDKNVTAMKTYFADEALLIFGDGSRFDKAQFMAFSADYRLDSIAIDERSVELRLLAPDSATLVYRARYSGAMKKARATSLSVLAASTYVRRNGQWLAILYQETPVK